MLLAEVRSGLGRALDAEDSTINPMHKGADRVASPVRAG
jgi:hypothetical protein